VTYIAVSALSHIGAVRDHHEDSLVAGPWTLCATVTASPQTLFFPLGKPLVVAVADGLGGHPGGEVASALVVRQLAQIGPLLDSCRLRSCPPASSPKRATTRSVTIFPGSVCTW
jgi:PPM family protein phosphatase